LMSPREAAALIQDGLTIGTVGTHTPGCAVGVFLKRSSSVALLLPFVYPACGSEADIPLSGPRR